MGATALRLAQRVCACTLVIEELAGLIQLLKDVLHEEVAATVLSASALISSFPEGEVGGGAVERVDLRDGGSSSRSAARAVERCGARSTTKVNTPRLKHPIGPAGWPPYKEDSVEWVAVWHVWQSAFLRCDAGRSAKRHRSATGGRSRAPVRD